MNKRMIILWMLCLFCVLSVTGLSEERKLGDYIYVPAMKDVAGGQISLRVEGQRIAEDGSTETVDCLPGAVFGIYVISAGGEMRPWASPLYPSEQMKIASGETETLFTLPANAEYYLIQEAAPSGYVFDSTPIPVTGEDLVIRNAERGILQIAVKDALDVPVVGAEVTVTAEDGTASVCTTDLSGIAVFPVLREGTYTLQETAIPEGAFGAVRMVLDGKEAAQTTGSVHAALAKRTEAAFIHPAAGTVELVMQMASVDDYGETVEKPLPGVQMKIDASVPEVLVTDGEGHAAASLLEGTYVVHFEYAGQENISLPYPAAQIVVQSGATTTVRLTAGENRGRILVHGTFGSHEPQGKVSLVREDTEETFGPYSFASDGTLITESLPVADYRLALQVPEGARCDSLTSDAMLEDESGAWRIHVNPAAVSRVEAAVRMPEKQQMSLSLRTVNEDGDTVFRTLREDLKATLVSESEPEAAVQVKAGNADIEGMSGSYRLRISAEDAERIGTVTLSDPFLLPSEDGTISFADSRGLLSIVSTTSTGKPARNAVYRVTEESGRTSEIFCDEAGIGLSSPLKEGTVRLSCVTAPEDCESVPETVLTVKAGQVNRYELMHDAYGVVQFSTQLQTVDDSGALQFHPLAGQTVNLVRNGGDAEKPLVTDENGSVRKALPQGQYLASFGDADPVAFEVANGTEMTVNLVRPDTVGALRITLSGDAELTDAEMAQVSFRIQQEGQAELAPVRTGRVFYAGGLTAGSYVLSETRMPEGYTRMDSRTVEVLGGQVTEVTVPLEEYATLMVMKTGLTFNDQMQTFIVPLTGEYGIFVREDEVLLPYPSEEQLTVWANTDDADGTRSRQVRLPASQEGTTYVVRELGASEGFAATMEEYEITLHAGEKYTLSATVASDRGFFEFEHRDIATDTLIPGGEFELLDEEGGQVLVFTTADGTYRNEMAIPVGEYTLRELRAPEGYALTEKENLFVGIEPYLTFGGQVSHTALYSVAVPEENAIPFAECYSAQEAGLTLVSVDGIPTPAGMNLNSPTLTMTLSADRDVPYSIVSATLSGPVDEEDTLYGAVVEYALAAGGWQPGHAVYLESLTAPVTIGLSDVEGDIRALRVYYYDANTGEEATRPGFTPGHISLCVAGGNAEDLTVHAEVEISCRYQYRTQRDGEKQSVSLQSSENVALTLPGGGTYAGNRAGRDGSISGSVFLDGNHDGRLDNSETVRLSDIPVRLLDKNEVLVEETRTDAEGRYSFSALSAGDYQVEMVGNDAYVFTEGEGSCYRTSRFGEDSTSELLTIDADHTDYLLLAGAVEAASVKGRLTDPDEDSGMGYVLVELWSDGEEPVSVVSDENGQYELRRLLPGTYRMLAHVPQGYLCREAKDGILEEEITLSAGQQMEMQEIQMVRAASLAGTVLMDSNGDGELSGDAAGIGGIAVSLLAESDGYTETVASTVSDSEGNYRFDNLYPGDYAVLFVLNDKWTFTRYGKGSAVYGSVSESGTTKPINLAAGQDMTDVNVGLTIPARLEVTVFQDTRMDGMMGNNEEPLANVTISLIRQENGEDAEEISYRTGADGTIIFSGISPGEYVIEYQMTGIWRTTRQADASASNYPVSFVPESRERTGRSAPFTLSMGQTGLHYYIGARMSGSISGVAYYDDDANAAKDVMEEAAEGIAVQLLDMNGSVLEETATGPDGAYVFEGLSAGRYVVRFRTEAGSGFSGTERSMARSGVQKSENEVSDTRTIYMEAGGAVTTADAGIVRLCSLSGTIYEDYNADGMFDGNEDALSGVGVHLMNDTGRIIIESVFTDAEGHYRFDHVYPGQYVLRIDAPEGYVFGEGGPVFSIASVRDSWGYSATISLSGSDAVSGIDYGLMTTATVSGSVFEDSNYNGFVDEGEEGLRGVTVTLLNPSGAEVSTVRTDREGKFSITGLLPGDYALRFQLEDGYVYTLDGFDSMAPRQDSTEAVLPVNGLLMGSTREEYRVGAVKPSRLGGVLWYDQDDDGRRVTGDMPMVGVPATLTVLSGGDAGRVMTVSTDEKGAYAFTGVMPGEVKISFLLPEGYAFAKRIAGSYRVSAVDETDALDASTDVMAIEEGTVRNDLDVGVVTVGVLTGTAFTDINYDGLMNSADVPLEGVRVILMTSDGRIARTVITDAQGNYLVPFVRKGSYYLRIVLPKDMMFTVNGDSIIGKTDERVANTETFTVAMGESMSQLNIGAIPSAKIQGTAPQGTSVALMTGGTVVQTVRVGQDGTFSLSGLRPGNYRARYALAKDELFAPGTELSGAGEYAQEGETENLTLALGEDMTLPSIYSVKGSTLTGRAWEDLNANGSWDTNEPPQAGVTVELLKGESQEAFRTAVTDETGTFTFSLLRADQYTIRFILPDGQLFADRTGEPGASCVDPTGNNVAQTVTFPLAEGEKLEMINVAGILPGEIGDTVWLDENRNGLQDYKEPLLTGVELELYLVANGTETLQETIQSDEYGYYAIRNLRPGDYRIKVVLRDGDELTRRIGDPLGEIDSDVEPETGATEVFHLNSGEHRRNLDVGFGTRP